MSPRDRARAERIKAQLIHFDQSVRPLPGIHPPAHLDVLVAQIIDSLRRVEFARYVGNYGHYHDQRRMDPDNDLFDPLRAAVLHHRAGRVDEAFWLVFLATHFGKHPRDGWLLVRNVYGRLGARPIWSWAEVTANQQAFRNWLRQNVNAIRGRFSSHRRYETIVSEAGNGTADVVESYIRWVAFPRSHQDLIRAAHEAVGQHPGTVFDHLYKSMRAVRRFGRLGRFDYLTMLSKLGFAPIEPDSAYLNEATGPLRGARLLFGGNTRAAISPTVLEGYFTELDERLGVGMQVLEDSLCNWQKRPSKYIYFAG